MIRMADGTWRLIGITSFYPSGVGDRCVAGGPFGFAWVAGPAMRDWPLTVAPPPVATPVPAIGDPGVVRKLAVKGRQSARKRTVTWRSPTTDGGASIARYQIWVYDGRKLLLKRTVVASRHYVALPQKKLHRGTNKVYVTAFNGSRYGPWRMLRFRVSR